MFSQSLCLPSKDQEIFFFVYFHIFWPEICMCRVLDQTLDVRDIDADVFIYGSNFLGGILFQKLSLFFLQSLTVDFSYMVHCRDPIFFLWL